MRWPEGGRCAVEGQRTVRRKVKSMSSTHHIPCCCHKLAVKIVRKLELSIITNIKGKEEGAPPAPTICQQENGSRQIAPRSPLGRTIRAVVRHPKPRPRTLHVTRTRSHPPDSVAHATARPSLHVTLYRPIPYHPECVRRGIALCASRDRSIPACPLGGSGRRSCGPCRSDKTHSARVIF